MKAEAAVWCATGPGRLPKTVATGRIISKAQCGRYTAGLFPEHADVLGRARAARLGGDAVGFTVADGWRLADLIDAVASAAGRL